MAWASRLALIRAVSGAPIMSVTASADEFSGTAIVRDDGMLSVGGRPVDLFGVHVPPTERACTIQERPIHCAPRAALELARKIGTRFVQCQELGVADGKTLAQCSVDGDDLGAWLLLEGWAVTTVEAPPLYGKYEEIARTRRRGLWGGPFDDLLLPR